MHRWFRVLAVLALAGLVSLGLAQEFDWRRFEGQNIRFLMNQHPFYNFIEPLVPEFEELTGIQVTLEAFPEDQFRQRRLLEVGAGTDTLDGYMLMPGQVGAQYLGAGWVRSIDDFLADPGLTMPDIDLDDFFGGAIGTFQGEAGTFGLPLQIESSLLFYRTDVFEENGLQPPETWDEFLAVAAQLSAPPDMYGTLVAGKLPSYIFYDFSSWLLGTGGKWTDESLNPTWTTPEAVEAFKAGAIDWICSEDVSGRHAVAGGVIDNDDMGHERLGATLSQVVEVLQCLTQQALFLVERLRYRDRSTPDVETISSTVPEDEVGITLDERRRGRTLHVGGRQLVRYCTPVTSLHRQFDRVPLPPIPRRC
jgi:hypothetical protein